MQWHKCDVHYLCAGLAVPLDYTEPRSPAIDLAVVELAATSRHPRGDIVFNPGGPGISGVQFIEQSEFPQQFHQFFNLVSFDPRGVGQSDPVHCAGAAQIRALVALDPAPASSAAVRADSQAAQQFDASCSAHTPASLLDNVSTAATARDMDRLREALGQPKLDYLGFSYGTYLGEQYAEMFPGHVGAMALDGVVDPELSDAAIATQQAAGFELNLKAFFAWCPTQNSCRAELRLGAQRSYQKLTGELAKGDKVYADLSAAFGGRQLLTLGVAETAAIGSLYSDQTWPALADGISQALAGNGEAMALAAFSYTGESQDGHFDNSLAAGTAISCADRTYPRQVSYYSRLAKNLAKAYPDFGAASAWSDLDCAFWPRDVSSASPAPVKVKRGLPTVLVIGSTEDPATPYSWAQAVASQLGRAGRLLTRVGPGHTAFPNSSCVQGLVFEYFSSHKLPPVGTRCPSSS